MKAWVLICFVDKWNFLFLFIADVVDIFEEWRTPYDSIRLVVGVMVLLVFLLLVSIENGLAHLRNMLLNHFVTIPVYFLRIWVEMSYIRIMMIKLTSSLLRGLLPIWAICLIAMTVSLRVAFQVLVSSSILKIAFIYAHLMINLRGRRRGGRFNKTLKNEIY